MEADVVDPQTLNVDRVFNLASPASQVHYREEPVSPFRTNVWGKYILLTLVTATGALYFQASKSEEYRDSVAHPQRENYRGNFNSTRTRSCNEEGKRGVEKICFAFMRTRDTRVKVVRISNTHEPSKRQDDGRMVSNFIVQAFRVKPLTVYGDETQTRSFYFVSDFIEGVSGMMNSDESITGPLNLGKPTEFSVLEPAETARSVAGSRSELRWFLLPDDDSKVRQTDIGKAKCQLGWEPTVPLREGIEKTVEYFKTIVRA